MHDSEAESYSNPSTHDQISPVQDHVGRQRAAAVDRQGKREQTHRYRPSSRRQRRPEWKCSQCRPPKRRHRLRERAWVSIAPQSEKRQRKRTLLDVGVGVNALEALLALNRAGSVRERACAALEKSAASTACTGARTSRLRSNSAGTTDAGELGTSRLVDRAGLRYVCKDALSAFRTRYGRGLRPTKSGSNEQSAPTSVACSSPVR